MIAGKYTENKHVTPLSCFDSLTAKQIYSAYLRGLDIEQIIGAMQLNYHQNFNPVEINGIIDQMNELYL